MRIVPIQRVTSGTLQEIVNNDENYIAEIYCDSTETKPTENIADGSKALETDTGDWYLFNEKSGSWIKMGTLKE